MLSAPDLTVAGLRALSFIALFQAAGAGIFLWLFRNELTVSAATLTRIARGTALAAIGLTLAHQLLAPARMMGTFSGVFDSDLQALVWTSNAGIARSLRLAGLGLLIVSLGGERSRFSVTVTAVGMIIVSFVLMGHVTTHEPRWLLGLLLLMHLVIITFWFGALLPLNAVARLESATVSASVLNDFSVLATGSVPLILGAGLGLLLLLLPDLEALIEPYGWLALAKLAVFSGLMGLAALNKWRLVPRVLTGDSASAATLRRSIRIEWALIAGVFVVTTVMTTFFSPETG